MFKNRNLLKNFEAFLTTICRSNSTIFALSSGHGKCGVAVIRVSGSSTTSTLKNLTGLSQLPKPRTAILRSLKHPETHEVLDKGLVLWFPGPHSFTGEDSCEFHVHGGIAVVNSVLNALSSLPKCRLAEPGEFTRRAFYNSKLDLTEVEGLADLLQAETEAQRKQVSMGQKTLKNDAFFQTQGSLSKVYNSWRERLVKSLAYVEAHIDFEETETIDEDVFGQVGINIVELKTEIQRHLDDGRKGELLRNGVKTVILGEPNVGKSSLLNVLCKRPAAIVTPIEGTTRDILEVTLNIGGYPLVLADTAGLRSETTDVIEKEGISRAMKSYEEADLVILVVDCLKYVHWLAQNPTKGFPNFLNFYVQKIGIRNLSDETFSKDCIVVFNKSDLLKYKLKLDCANLLSCKNQEGVSSLVANITNKLKVLCGNPSAEHPSMNQQRHRQHLTNCIQSLDSCLSIFSSDTVLMAEHLRKALKHLGYLVGATTTEQLLDVIFKDFCIGK